MHDMRHVYKLPQLTSFEEQDSLASEDYWKTAELFLKFGLPFCMPGSSIREDQASHRAVGG